MKEEQVEEPNEVSEESDDEEDVASKPGAVIRKEEVWREMFLTSNGRDKGLVCKQTAETVYDVQLVAFFSRN